MATVAKKFGAHRIGPGGMKCACCGPAPGPTKKQLLRAFKRSEKQLAKLEIQKELIEEEG